MKYPEKQYTKLVESLKILSVHFDNLKEVNLHSLHFLVYQQFAEGQDHNSFCLLDDGKICRAGFAKGNKNRLFEKDFDFMLYPEGCNDNHIETAMKNAIKAI